MGFFGSSFLFANIAGLTLLGLGLVTRLGYFRRMFILEKKKGLHSRSTPYALIPAGIFLLSFYPIALWKGDKPTEDVFVVVLLSILFILPLIAMVWQPRWLKPSWLQWLEANYSEPMLEKLFEHAREMGAEWEIHTRKQADLEWWAESVTQKRKRNRKLTKK